MPRLEVVDKRAVEDAADKTAVIYLRVSSPGQLTGHNPEGYSIEGQRLACERYAEQLAATVVRQYVEPGKSATNLRRPQLQMMLADLPELRPTYVIFYDLSRVARDEFDAFWLLREIKNNGAKLESTMERIDDSDDGMLLYTMLTGINAHRSRRDGKKVKMGLERKLAEGGTIGPAPIGYLNARQRINGREVRVVELDSERAPLVKLAFDAFATGEYSITGVCDLLEASGLKTRETATRPSKPLTRSGVYRILRDRYYIGMVTRNGVSREGLHSALIDEATFEKVQQLLVSRRLAGDRSRKHRHYLKGSLFCSCGERLTWGRHRGNGGIYEYFCCLSNQRPRRRGCGHGYMAVDPVERAVESYYRRVSLSAAQCEAAREIVREQVAERLNVARTQSEQHARRLRQLQDDQQKLLQLYYKGGVSDEVLVAEQERIETERAQARKLVEAASHEAEDVFEALDEILRLIGPDCHETYLHSDPQTRRLLNQAIFERLIVTPEGVEGEPQHVVTDLRQIVAKTPCRARQRGQTHRGPQSLGGHGSHFATMVPRAGLEPAPPD